MSKITSSAFVNGFMVEIQKDFDPQVVDRITEMLSTYTLGYDISPVVAFGTGEDYELPQAYHLFMSAMKQDGKMTKTTERQYRMCLERMLNSIRLPLTQITVNHLRLHIDDISVNKKTGKPLSQSTLNQRKSIIRSFFGFCIEEGFIEKNPALRIKRAKEDSRPREAFSDEDAELIRENSTHIHSRSHKANLRTRAAIDLLASSGIRISELIGLNISDIDFDRREFMVFGKGRKWRMCYMDARAAVSLREYLSSRTDNNDALFVSGRSPYNRVIPNTIRSDLKQCGVISHVDGVYPHRYRHTVATEAIDRGMSVASIQKMLGHESIETTMRYAHVSNSKVEHDHRMYIR